jgi:hypothetical protein
VGGLVLAARWKLSVLGPAVQVLGHVGKGVLEKVPAGCGNVAAACRLGEQAGPIVNGWLAAGGEVDAGAGTVSAVLGEVNDVGVGRVGPRLHPVAEGLTLDGLDADGAKVAGHGQERRS